MLLRSLPALVLFSSLLAPLEAADWTEFRGPTGQGLSNEERLPVEWSDRKNVVWKVATPPGWSSPVVVGGKVYLTGAVSQEGGHSLRALGLSAADGKVLWDHEVFNEAAAAPRPHPKNSHASPTPLVEGDRLYVHFGHQGTACLDLDGKIMWTNRELTYRPVHGNGGSPILVEDLLIFSCDGGSERFIAALDKASGKVRWKTDREGDADRKFSFSTPLLIDVKGQKQVISPGSDVVCAYGPATGKELWRARYEGYSVIPRPVYGHGLVFLSTGYNVPNLLAIRPDGSGDVTATHIVWRQRQNAPHTPSPLLVGNELYTVSDGGIASCLDARTGKAHWQKRLGGAYSASPLCAAGKVYFQSEQGVGTVVAASTTFKQLAHNDLGERSLASYAAADGSLFIRTEHHLYRIGTKVPTPAGQGDRPAFMCCSVRRLRLPSVSASPWPSAPR
jgi:outer membrane protein assembly factor BamB